MEPINALAVVFERNAFYRRMHFLALGALALAIGVIAVLAWVIYFLFTHQSPPIYFAADNIGRLIKIIPRDQPNMSTEEVIAWTIDAVESAYSYDHVNYRQQLQSAQKYFTQYGWDNYRNALRASNNLLSLTERKQIVIAEVVEQPKITSQGLLSGAYAWKMEMPILVTYWEPPYDEKSKFLNALQVRVIVQRQDILQSYKGLGVLQMIASFATGSAEPQEISATPTE